MSNPQLLSDQQKKSFQTTPRDLPSPDRDMPLENYPNLDADQSIHGDNINDSVENNNGLSAQIKGEENEEYSEGAYNDGLSSSRFIIREQDRWLPIANGMFILFFYSFFYTSSDKKK